MGITPTAPPSLTFRPARREQPPEAVRGIDRRRTVVINRWVKAGVAVKECVLVDARA